MIAALASTGSAAGDLRGVSVDVLIVSAEDDPSDTIRPRLEAAGACLERVHLVDAREVVDGIPLPSTVSLPGDAPKIERLVRDLGGPSCRPRSHHGFPR
jgi:hypothetical protein